MFFTNSSLDSQEKTDAEKPKEEEKPDFSHLSDDNPVKKLCMEHPSLSTCKRFIKPADAEKVADPNQEEQPVQSTTSISSYIKSFTRWMNSCIYAVISYFVECFRALFKILLSYTIGLVLSIGGKAEVMNDKFMKNKSTTRGYIRKKPTLNFDL